MKNPILLTSLVLFIILSSMISACSTPQPDSTKDTQDESDIDANALYTTNCARCHGNNREGSIGPVLNPDSLEALQDYEVKTIISDGRGRMPSWKTRLTDQEINALVQFIKHVSPD